MRVLITIDRIKSILADAKTEADASMALRRHHIKYSYSTAGGILHMRIPARSGVIRITRTASRTRPLFIEYQAAAPVPDSVPDSVPHYTDWYPFR